MRTQEMIAVDLGDEDQGEESRVITLPTKFVVCGTCDGRGKHSQRLGAFTRDDMDEQGPDFMDDYMAGLYDSTCETCNGERVVAVVDREAVERSGNADFKAALHRYDENARIDAELDAEQAAEMRYCYGPNY